MKKWLILLGAVAITGGSYLLFTQANKRHESTAAASKPVDVEEFEAPADDSTASLDTFDGDFEDHDDPTQGLVNNQEQLGDSTHPGAGDSADFEMIEDADAPMTTGGDQPSLDENKSFAPVQRSASASR